LEKRLDEEAEVVGKNDQLSAAAVDALDLWGRFD
jgi:hypothetical protein